MIDITIAFACGILAGIITGLLPGIHINLVIASILGTSMLSSSLSMPLVVFIIALTFTHIVIDFIPTTLLGVPSDDNYLAMQPAHRLVLEGKALEAIKVAILGVLLSIPLMIALFPLYALSLPRLFGLLDGAIPYLLLGISVYLIFTEKNVLGGIMVFLISGAIGFLAFNLPVREPLLPLLSGLFGVPSLLQGLLEDRAIPKQRVIAAGMRIRNFIKPLIANFFVSPILSFFPGIGAGHISLFVAEMTNPTSKQFIFINSMASSLNMFLSIVAAYSIGKTRTGTSAAIKGLLSPISGSEMIVVAALSITAVMIACYVGNELARPIIIAYNKVPYKEVALATIIFVVAVNAAFSNSIGMTVLSTAAAVGILCQRIGVRKMQLMGSLLVPTLMYYFIG